VVRCRSIGDGTSSPDGQKITEFSTSLIAIDTDFSDIELVVVIFSLN